jgi:hypothetical protein
LPVSGFLPVTIHTFAIALPRYITRMIGGKPYARRPAESCCQLAKKRAAFYTKTACQ